MDENANLLLWGIDHHRAPTEVREQAHLADDRLGDFYDALRKEDGYVSCVPVITCNRTEIYLETRPGFRAHEALGRVLTAVDLDPELFMGEFGLRLQGREAVAQLYRVAAGMESMMLGEPQIAAQLKDAYRKAKEHEELGPVIMRAFQGAFRAGKCVRTGTKIGAGAVSVAFAAVELARKFFTSLSEHRALLVGAGETGALAARHFLQQGVGGLTVVNRNPEKAVELASELNLDKGELVRARPWNELVPAMTEANVVLSTTGAVEPVITKAMVREAFAGRQGHPLFLLDIAVPRDVEAAVADLEGAYVFGLDDLDGIVQTNLAARRRELPKAERILEAELNEYQAWIRDLDLRPTVAEFRSYLEDLKEKQVGWVRKKESDDVAAAVDRSLQQFIKKVLGRSMKSLKNADTQEERLRHLDALRHLFGPDSDKDEPERDMLK